MRLRPRRRFSPNPSWPKKQQPRRRRRKRQPSLRRRRGNRDPFQPRPTLTARGIELFNEGRFQESIDQFTKAIALDPNYREAWERAGGSLREAGQAGTATGGPEAVGGYLGAAGRGGISLAPKPDFATSHRAVSKVHSRNRRGDSRIAPTSCYLHCHYVVAGIYRDYGAGDAAGHAAAQEERGLCYLFGHDVPLERRPFRVNLLHIHEAVDAAGRPEFQWGRRKWR